MKKFLAIYLGTPAAMESFRNLPETERKAREAQGIAAWHAWAERHKAAIVELGSPLGRTKRIGKDGITDVRNAMGAWTVVQADSQEAAAKLFLDHPHFAIFPGDSVEVMECLQIPGM